MLLNPSAEDSDSTDPRKLENPVRSVSLVFSKTFKKKPVPEVSILIFKMENKVVIKNDFRSKLSVTRE